MKVTIRELWKMKKQGSRVALLTAYEYFTAKLEDEAGIDIILVGDSVGMTHLGYSSTLPVSMEDMLIFGKAVSRAVERAMVIMDMPYLSYQPSTAIAIENAGKFMRIGVDGVKLEGGVPISDTIKRMIDIGIPVMGHIGLTPQSIKLFGGYRVRGRNEEERESLLRDARSLEDAGVFSIIVEGVPTEVTKEIRKAVSVPIYGIGAGSECDGQILVVNDILGLSGDFSPKFVKKYADLSPIMMNAFKQYIKEVKSGLYPDKAHSYE